MKRTTAMLLGIALAVTLSGCAAESAPAPSRIPSPPLAADHDASGPMTNDRAAGGDGTGTPGTVDREVADRTSGPGRGAGGAASLAESFDSLTDLRDASELVIVGTAGAAVVERLEGMDFTVTDVRIERSSDPSRIGETVRVRQTGAVGEPTSEELTELLIAGERYVLFLRPFHLVPGRDTGQYCITGERGLWHMGANGTHAPGFPDDAAFGPLTPADITGLGMSD